MIINIYRVYCQTLFLVGRGLMFKTRDIKGVTLTELFMTPKFKQKTPTQFGQHLKKLRQVRGLTQTELGKLIGASTRMVEHYENQAQYPPISLVSVIAKALKCSADELLGIKNLPDEELVKIKNLMRRLRVVENFPLRDQRIIFSMINTIKAKHTSQSKNGTK